MRNGKARAYRLSARRDVWRHGEAAEGRTSPRADTKGVPSAKCPNGPEELTFLNRTKLGCPRRCHARDTAPGR